MGNECSSQHVREWQDEERYYTVNGPERLLAGCYSLLYFLPKVVLSYAVRHPDDWGRIGVYMVISPILFVYIVYCTIASCLPNRGTIELGLLLKGTGIGIGPGHGKWVYSSCRAIVGAFKIGERWVCLHRHGILIFLPRSNEGGEAIARTILERAVSPEPGHSTGPGVS